LDVFEAYCEHVVSVHGLADRVWRVEVQQVLPGEDDVLVCTFLDDVRASSVVLCSGEKRAQASVGWGPGTVPPEHVYYWNEPLPAGYGHDSCGGSGVE